jgi:hypothetical protein
LTGAVPMRTSVRLDIFRGWGDARAARGRNRTRNSPGAGGPEGSGIPIADLAARTTSRSTIGPTNSATSTPPLGERKLCSKSDSSFSLPTSATTPASIAARPTPSSLSSTTCGTRNSGSRPASGTATGATCSMRLQSATWFVQTVIDAAPQNGVASSARR